MINIFYNKNTLNDTLTINFLQKIPNRTVSFKDRGVALYADDDLVGINIFNLSKYLGYPTGYLYPTKYLHQYILNFFNIDILKYHYKKFVVGKVISCENIENTKLNKCLVDLGNQKLVIVCGGTNVSEGIYVVVAMIGAALPNGRVIQENKIMGIDSFGMICSESELNPKIKKSDGSILILDNSKYNVGDEYLENYSNYNK